MKFFRFDSEQWLPCPATAVFAFFSDAGNLQLITPPQAGGNFLVVAETRERRETAGTCSIATLRSAVYPVNFNSNFLFASLFWGSVGVGYWIYGKRRSAMSPMFGGVAMIGVSYLVSSWLLMSLLCIAIGAGVFAMLKREV